MGGICSANDHPILDKMSHQQRQIAGALLQPHDQSYGKGVLHQFYLSKLGKIRNADVCRHYDISNGESQVLLQDTEFYFEDSLGLKEKTLEIFYEKDFSFQNLKQAISNSVQEKEYLKQYFDAAAKNAIKFKNEMNTTKQIAEACCLAISYYTGFYKESLDRDSNLIIKLTSFDVIDCIRRTKELQDKLCIGYWLLKAISHLPTFTGEVTRCINIKADQQAYYEEGNLVTWLQFSSSSEGQFIPAGYQTRNTRFHIFSITGRAISSYSTYEQFEKEVLFKPFTHFIVLKKQRQGDILHVYMREIAIGKSSLNILFVDDKIFSPDWEYKQIVEAVAKKNPRITIIPKSSTKTAMAFINSDLGKERKKNELRIITTLVRQNQENPENAGAVLLRELEKLHIVTLNMMLFSKNPEAARLALKRLLVKLLLKITDNNEDLLSFASFK